MSEENQRNNEGKIKEISKEDIKKLRLDLNNLLEIYKSFYSEESKADFKSAGYDDVIKRYNELAVSTGAKSWDENKKLLEIKNEHGGANRDALAIDAFLEWASFKSTYNENNAIEIDIFINHLLEMMDQFDGLSRNFIYDTKQESPNLRASLLRLIILLEKLRGDELNIKKLHIKVDNRVHVVDTTNITDNLKGDNTILYGVPGCGKSFKIKEKVIKKAVKSVSLRTKIEILTKNIDYKDYNLVKQVYTDLENEELIIRVVFHPDYTYSDFVGQILPKVEGDGEKTRVSYEFKPGPFTRILSRAYEKRDMAYFLIIEEINRGNAAAIFGDLFQLLDREDHQSEYPVDNYDIAKEVIKHLLVLDQKEKKDEKDISKIADEKLYEMFNEYCENNKALDNDLLLSDLGKKKIKLPRNLWIFATMNTSDQNVYPLDTAFQRRWNMERIKNEFTEDKHSFMIGDTNVTWKEFAEKINEEIVSDKNSISSGDKRLGAYFVLPDDGNKVSDSLFANKVIKYLWDDVCKLDKTILFHENYQAGKVLDDVIEKFLDNKGVERLNDTFNLIFVGNPSDKQKKGEEQTEINEDNIEKSSNEQT